MSQSSEAWTEVAEQISALGSTLKDHYAAQDVAPRDEPVTQDEVREALRTLGDAATAALGTVGEALKDPTINAEIKATAGSFVNAVGISVSELGADISAIDRRNDTSPPLTHAEPVRSNDADQPDAGPESE